MLAPASISHSFSPFPFLLCPVAYSLPGLARSAPLSASHFSYPFSLYSLFVFYYWTSNADITLPRTLLMQPPPT